MLFNTIGYALFLLAIFILYWFVCNRSLKLQNLLLLAASYFFYSCWDWRFTFLLLFSTLLDFYSGIKIAGAERMAHRKLWVWLSIGINLGLLGVFKYYNFFAASFAQALASVGLKAHPATLGLVLPVGISFYTFHGLSYIIDIYKKRIGPERNFISYGVFVSFFPLLVAGPIERATHLLPQIKRRRVFDYNQAADGLRQILWGLFKKVVIADQCATYANAIFSPTSGHTGSTLALGAVLFAFQIYGDFSGYSDIALGTARLLGIELLRNFNYPYFSRDIAEFWRRWHISLSSWFRDYVYIPLGGNKGGALRKARNVLVIFALSGFWHGANWTFICWGLLNAMYIMPLVLLGGNRSHIDIVAQGSRLPSLREFGQMLLTFALTTFAWIFFRAEDITHAFRFIRRMCSVALLQLPAVLPKGLLVLIFFFILIEWNGRMHEFAIKKFLLHRQLVLRYAFYLLLLLLIFCFGGGEQQFIYFQF